MGKKIFEKNNDKKTKIIFEKLTVKEVAKVKGGDDMNGGVCVPPEKPIEHDCPINQK